MDTCAAPVWSHLCDWVTLADAVDVPDAPRTRPALRGPVGSWNAVCCYSGRDVEVAVPDLAAMPLAGREPVRRFAWHRAQRHRAGLEFLVSTGRHHGYESLQEARLLRVVDFAAGAGEVLSQPLRLRFTTVDGPREHIPDFLVCGHSGWWLVDVRPRQCVRDGELAAFAAAAQVAAVSGWGYVVVGGWKPHVWSTVDAMSAHRRPLSDVLDIGAGMLAAVSERPRSFGELTGATVLPAVARAVLLHLLWHRRVGIDLTRPLGEHTLVRAAARGGVEGVR
ncbi:TnsA-like heteromeric transposase endonuclease subunit [Lentzea sp. BCCO 10_0798]|uniref:TnsA-like heteromeric transposase endonuclease subunit n=1 Tax=Lentzea kristufekii TaxID=3095430 RepID=A0ABU4TZU7_9PSEU|nr:TnsA-like heteromeric transposase endonuclease subunit [Lentzea sp. BCCO 10_0798]MDX8053841.1 TnsA-like heteromeric transposase endonuclease subunit [Lentzea sp. BCCO 10_0798]